MVVNTSKKNDFYFLLALKLRIFKTNLFEFSIKFIQFYFVRIKTDVFQRGNLISQAVHFLQI